MSNVTAAVAEASWNAAQWMQILGLGGLAGAIGQGARAIIGLKKTNDAASAPNVSTRPVIEGSRMIVSLAIGFVAGALAGIGLIDNLDVIPTEKIFALTAAGYAGGDFIEGLISRVSGTQDVAPGQEALGVPAPAANAANASDDAVG